MALDMASGATSSIAIAESVVSKCNTINQALGTVILDKGFTDIITVAKSVDNLRSANMDNGLPILAGIPISIKDNFNVSGTKTTAGSG